MVNTFLGEIYHSHFTRVYGRYMVNGVMNQHMPVYNWKAAPPCMGLSQNKRRFKIAKLQFQCRTRGSIRKIWGNLFSDKPRRNQVSICTQVITCYNKLHQTTINQPFFFGDPPRNKQHIFYTKQGRAFIGGNVYSIMQDLIWSWSIWKVSCNWWYHLFI